MKESSQKKLYKELGLLFGFYAKSYKYLSSSEIIKMILNLKGNCSTCRHKADASYVFLVH